MTRRTAIWGFAALGVAAVAIAGYAWLRPKPDSPLTPSLERGAVVSASEYRLSGPYTHANLTVFLVHGPETLGGTSFLTLQEALEQKKVIVHETGSVDELAVESVAEGEDVFVQAGDIVKGGKQDRTFQYDAVVGPKSGRVPVASFCVEQGRWSKRKDESPLLFDSSSSSVSTSENRRAANSPGESNQSEVWRNVARTQERLGKKIGSSVQSEASASSLQLTLESQPVRDAVAPYLALGPILHDHNDVIGYVAAVNGRVVAADVYASRALFRKLWPKLLDGSAVEAFIESDPGRGFDPVQGDAVRAFLAEGEGAALNSDAVTERTYVQVRRTDRVMLVESCDRSRGNLVLHRSFLAR
jgi:hypothetical protein